MARYLRNKKDGFIYDWHPILAQNSLCEEVTEEQAYPERFLEPEVVEKVEKVRTRRGKLDLTTAEVVEPPPVVNQDIAADASRRLP